MYDNTSGHRSRGLKHLSENNVFQMKSPACILDINIIKNICYIKKKNMVFKLQPKSTQKLKDIMQKACQPSI